MTTTQTSTKPSGNGVHSRQNGTAPQTDSGIYVPTGVNGKTLELRLFGVADPGIMADMGRLKSVLRKSIDSGNLHIVKNLSHKFKGGGEGATHIYILSESEFSVSTWPEFGYMISQIHTCGETSDPWKTGNQIVETLLPKHFTVQGSTESGKVEFEDIECFKGRRIDQKDGTHYYEVSRGIRLPPVMSDPIRTKHPLLST